MSIPNFDPYADLGTFDEEPPAEFEPPVHPVTPVPSDHSGSGFSGAVATGSPVPPVTTGFSEGVLDRVRTWFGRYVCTVQDTDLDVLTLWAAHTHFTSVIYTTPRLVVDSPVPGSGKTTCLEHMSRLCLRPLQAASLSSPAMLARLLDKEPRTILIDEADRNLDPKRPGVEDLLAVINAGYKQGATRPVLVPGAKGEWNVAEMSTFSPLAMAGNHANLPDDTTSRTIRVLLLPDLDGRVEESDWEQIEIDAADLAESLSQWATQVSDIVRTARPELPAGCIGRAKERWNPLRRVAEAAGGRWPAACDELIRRDMEEAEMNREDGLSVTPPAVTLLRDIAAVWTEGESFVPTRQLVPDLIRHNPGMWGEGSNYGHALTVQRLGRMLARGYKVNSERPGGAGPRGYSWDSLARAWRRMGVTPPSNEPAVTGGTGEPAATNEGAAA